MTAWNKMSLARVGQAFRLPKADEIVCPAQQHSRGQKWCATAGQANAPAPRRLLVMAELGAGFSLRKAGESACPTNKDSDTQSIGLVLAEAPGNSSQRKKKPAECSTLLAFKTLGRNRSGVTLIELLLVIGLISLLVGISFPAIASGIDAVRLRTAADSIASFLNSALNRAERRQQVIEVEFDKNGGIIRMRSAEPGFERDIEMPEGIRIDKILPELPEDSDAPRRFLLYPGGVVPRVGVEIANSRGARRKVSVDPITGVPQVETPEAQ